MLKLRLVYFDDPWKWSSNHQIDFHGARGPFLSKLMVD